MNSVKPEIERPVITLVGCGRMGGALLRGWVAAGFAEKIHVLEPAGLPDEFKDAPGVVRAETVPPCDVVVLAIKPQGMDAVCAEIRPGGAFILSIAAGRTIAGFERHFGAACPVVRAMPNTPAAIARGITVAVANPNATPAQKDIADRLLQAVGQVEWVDNESLLDAVTALSGSGPAYVFYLIEVLARAGAEAGLDPVFAMRLARATVTGSGALADADANTPAGTLRRNVTSPGGTTEAALAVLMDGRMQDVFTQAIAAAAARSGALSR